MELHELMGKLHKLELVQQLAHRRGAQEHGLYFGQMPVLDFIAANPGCTQVQVADHLRVSPASISSSFAGRSNLCRYNIAFSVLRLLLETASRKHFLYCHVSCILESELVYRCRRALFGDGFKSAHHR